MKRILPLLLCCLLLTGCAVSPAAKVVPTPPPDAPAITVNGEIMTSSEYRNVESAYLAQAEAAGANLADANLLTYYRTLARDYAVEQMLVQQDMKAQGCYEFDAETEAWCAEQGKGAYAAALQQVKDTLGTASSTPEELEALALDYAASLSVTEQTYVDFYRDQYASAKYLEWLTRENPVTETDVKAAYETRVEASRNLYGDDAAAFETAASQGNEAWYKPAGYRSILQILLPMNGATAEEKLANAQPTVDAIVTRLEQGESFQALITEFGMDANMVDEVFQAAGYQVHRDSIVWEQAFIDAAFSAEMATPGCWSKPFASNLGVHILYYLADSPAGAVELTPDLYNALAYAIYTERCTAARGERLTELLKTAQIEFH